MCCDIRVGGWGEGSKCHFTVYLKHHFTLEMAERHELTLKLLVTDEEEEIVMAMLNQYGFDFRKIGELYFVNLMFAINLQTTNYRNL